MELFALINSNGQFMRAKGFSGDGDLWVDGIKPARIYTHVEPAKAQATYWKRNYPEYECPKIAVLEATVKNVLDQEERVAHANEIQKKREATSRKNRIVRQINKL